jgi:multiple sugar transport system permease protein
MMLDLRSLQAKLVIGTLALVIGFFLFFPVYWLVASSLKPDAELYRLQPTLFPETLTLKHFSTAIFEGNLLLHLTNSLIVSLSSAGINTVLALYAGYSFAKYRYFGRKPVMLFMLSAQMFPFGLLLITIYPMFTDLGLIDTRLGLMLSYIVFALPVATYMLYSYFTQIPNELIEAARADGASDLRILHTIVLPISLPPLITVFLYSFMWSWNDLLYSLTLIVSEDKRTVGPGLLLTYLNESNADWGGAMAASLLAAMPVVIGFMLLQRFFIQGVTAGAVK